MAEAVRIEGLRELERAFKLYGRGMEKGLREAMEAGAEVVRPAAESLARESLKPARNVDWSLMRVGVTRRTAYVAPAQRGRRGKLRPNAGRPNMRQKLLGESMEPALEANTSRVESEFKDALNDLARMWSRV
jgi:hypothetical protein